MPPKPKTQFLATALRGRPQRFAELIGQEHITRVLQGALERGKVSHAYLFAGPRGVGKTSTARILAKALNCEQGMVREPCNTCSQCRSITAGNHIDVIEIDAASNRKIENIRDLREAVRFSPAVARTKVYIVDEVHQLTPDAFDALLKTLEEPPGHSKFILATTEEHKVPETILSRCQRFHFRKIPVVQIIESLRRVYAEEKESHSIPDSVFSYVARAARGSIRDAQSLMDQILAFMEERITLEDVETLLGAVEFETLLRFVDCVHRGEMEAAIGLIDDISQRGRDMAQFLRDLIELYRNLLVAQSVADPQRLIDLAPEQVEAAVQAARRVKTETLLRALEVLFAAETQLKSTVDDRLVVELATFKLAKLTESVTLKELIARVEGWAEAESPKGASKAEARPVAAVGRPAGQTSPTSPVVEYPEPPPLEEERLPPPMAPKPPRIEMIEPGAGVPPDLWRLFLEDLHEQSPKVASFLDSAQPLSFQNDRLTVAIPKVHQFQYQQLKRDANNKAISKSLERVFNKKVRVEWVLKDLEVLSDSDVPPEGQLDQAQLIEQAAEDPHVREMLDLFEGKVVERRVRQGKPKGD